MDLFEKKLALLEAQRKEHEAVQAVVQVEAAAAEEEEEVEMTGDGTLDSVGPEELGHL